MKLSNKNRSKQINIGFGKFAYFVEGSGLRKVEVISGANGWITYIGVGEREYSIRVDFHPVFPSLESAKLYRIEKLAEQRTELRKKMDANWEQHHKLLALREEDL